MTTPLPAYQAAVVILHDKSLHVHSRMLVGFSVPAMQVLSDWDRFARGEYLRLAVEEEPDDMQVDAADDMWSNGRAAGSKMLLEDVDADDDLVPGLGAAGAGGAGDLLSSDDGNGAAAMDASS